MPIEITDEMQRAFLAARDAALREGATSTAYVDGIRAVLDIVERDEVPAARAEVLRRADAIARATCDGRYAIDVVARENGVEV